jgi:hypothetical protein
MGNQSIETTYHLDAFYFVLESLDFSSLTSKTFWLQLTNEAKAKYNFDLTW